MSVYRIEPNTYESLEDLSGRNKRIAKAWRIVIVQVVLVPQLHVHYIELYFPLSIQVDRPSSPAKLRNDPSRLFVCLQLIESNPESYLEVTCSPRGAAEPEYVKALGWVLSLKTL